MVERCECCDEELPRYVLHTGGWFRQWEKAPGIGPADPTKDEYWVKSYVWMDPERPYDWAYDSLTTPEKMKADGRD